MRQLRRWSVIAWGMVLCAGMAGKVFAAPEEAAPARSTGAAASAPATPFVGTVTGSTVNIRAGGNRNYEVIHQGHRGETLIVTGQQGDWYAVELPPEASCFIAAQFVARDNSSAGQVAGTNVNLRGGPGTKYNVLGKVSTGEPLVILGEEDGWLRIVPPAAARGWIAASFVQPDPTTTLEAVRAAYDARQAAIASTPLGLVPPTGAGTVGGHAPTAGPPLAQGRVERARGFWRRPGTHRLIREGKTVAHLTSPSISLDDYLHQEVSVWGSVADPSSTTPAITVTHLLAASTTTPAPQPAAATPAPSE